MTHSMTIRMGAARWDATIHQPHAHFDFRTMTTDQRKAWYRAFMDSVRTMYGKGDERPPRRRRHTYKHRRRKA
jgi:hypothetical protein